MSSTNKGPNWTCQYEQPSSSSSMLEPRHKDNTLKNYTITSTKLGSGSMGKVRLAEHNETHEKFAVKIIRSNPQKHKNQRKLVVREARITQLLDHPHIAKVHELVCSESNYYLIMEYVNGGQLLDYMNHKRISEKRARKLARQIASALDYCHSSSIVHRDLKMENILVTLDGTIKMVDFGLSNWFSNNSKLHTHCGSHYFAAPELLRAKQYVGPEIDIWSFGVVLYTLVCGMVPFEDPSLPKLHAKIKKGFVYYPPHLTSECKKLISRMLVVDVSNRAKLSEIMVHPWMTRGFDAPIENYVPDRPPLTNPVDAAVVEKMVKLGFGKEREINAQLRDLIGSKGYERRRRSSVFSMFTVSKEQQGAYHPLVSIYYLVRESMGKRDNCQRRADDVASSSGGVFRRLSAFFARRRSSNGQPSVSRAA